jgi:BirA family biotin operon repressor/biotin-[acetyl-CoA-carboxylase] ligase
MNNLSADCQVFDGGGLWDGRLLLFDELPSTNMWAMENLGLCRNGDVVSAMRQTAGHGRFSRPWLSPEGRGLALSVILTEIKQEQMVVCIGQLAAIAVVRTLESFDMQAMHKWPNDVLVDGMKIAGILSERDAATGTIVLGVGLNVGLTRSDLRAAHLAGTATSMWIEQKNKYDPAVVRAAFTAKLQETLEETSGKPGNMAMLAAAWAQYDGLAGSTIEVTSETGAVVRGKYAGMDEAGRLQLVDDTGNHRIFWTGDVQKTARVS